MMHVFRRNNPCKKFLFGVSCMLGWRNYDDATYRCVNCLCSVFSSGHSADHIVTCLTRDSYNTHTFIQQLMAVLSLLARTPSPEPVDKDFYSEFGSKNTGKWSFLHHELVRHHLKHTDKNSSEGNLCIKCFLVNTLTKLPDFTSRKALSELGRRSACREVNNLWFEDPAVFPSASSAITLNQLCG